MSNEYDASWLYDQSRPYDGISSQTITCTGFDALAFGTTLVSFSYPPIAPAGIKIDVYGMPELSGGVREVLVAGIDPGLFGDASVTLGVRELFPFWWVDTRFGAAQVGYHQTVAPTGWESLVVGAHDVRDNRQYAAPTGIASLDMGTEVRIGFARRTISAPPVEPNDFDRWTPPRIYNVRQVIAPEYAPGRWIEGGFGDEQVMRVRNKNRAIDLVNNGIPPVFRSVSPFASVVNKARVLRPAGLDATLWGQSLIAPYIRSIFPEGFDAFRFDRFTNVYNAAAQLLPAGAATLAIGTASVRNTRRFLTFVGAGEQSAFGTPFVAPRVRELAPTTLDPPRGRMGAATIWFRNREVTPIAPAFGWGGFFGRPTLEIHRAIVQPNSIAPINGVSTAARVANKTPQLYPYWDSDLFTRWGRPNVFNEFSTYAFQGWVSSVFGTAFVDYRNKRLHMHGFDAFRPNLLHRVRNTDPDPPGVQYVVDATAATQLQFGMASLGSNSAFPPGIDSVRFGTAVVAGRGIRPAGIPIPYNPDTGSQLGIPSLAPSRTIGGVGLGSTELWPKPDFQPRTIWAPFGAPEQAKANHPPGLEEPIDAFLDRTNPIRPLFGTPGIELKNRRYNIPSLGDQSAGGVPTLTQRPLYVQVAGTRFTRYGIPVLNGGGRIDAYSPSAFDVFGDATVVAVDPFIRYVLPDGLSTLVFRPQTIANFNRDLPPAGIDSLSVGDHVVQRPPPPAEPPGLDATLWGDGTFIAYRVRHVEPAGEETLAMDFEMGFFDLRLRVIGSYSPAGMAASVGETSSFGTPSLDGGVRSINALTVLPQGGYFSIPKVIRRNLINVPGNGPLDEWGETWALPVTPGTIQPRGDDELRVGAPTLHQRISAAGNDELAIGAAIIAGLIGGTGFDASQFAPPTVLGFGCGTRVRAMVGFDALSMGTAAVSGA